MNIIPRSIIGLVILAILMGCGTANSTSTPTPILSPFSQSTPDIDTHAKLQTATKTPWPSFTPHPTQTLDLTQTAVMQDQSTALVAEQTLIAQYPRVCSNTYAPQRFSPNGLWLEELCYSEADQSLILTLSNKDTQVLWKLLFGDYADLAPDGGISVVSWSNDGKYAYFNSYAGGDGGECFISGTMAESGLGLFRLDLQTGIITTILPLKDNFGWYTFAFSSTGRRLVYGAYARDFTILDINTGQLINVVPAKDFSEGGGHTWSPDGLKLVYSTVLDNEISEPIVYSLRLADAQSGSERILLESANDCLVVRSWADNNILTIESYGENLGRTLIEYDLDSNTIIHESAATPGP